MLIAVGDIHGNVWKLRDLLTRLHELPLQEDDRLVFLGDYVDRGAEVPLTLDLLIQLKSQRPNTVFLRGNHDQAMMDVRDVVDPERETKLGYQHVSWWFQYGGRETMAGYGGGSEWYQNVPPEHWEFLQATELEHREGGYIFVHAGLLPPGKRWFDPEDPRMWIRELFLESDADFGGIVVFGHTPTRDGNPIVHANKIGIDTGAAFGGPLTAALLQPHHPEQTRYVQV
jgi:serine/threonine protein phosphatase 1